MVIKQSVINTFNRVGIPYEELLKKTEKEKIANWLTGATCETSALIAHCVNWVYQKQLDYEGGNMGCRQDDFDRVRYFILAQDKDAYYTCID